MKVVLPRQTNIDTVVKFLAAYLEGGSVLSPVVSFPDVSTPSAQWSRDGVNGGAP